MPVKPAPRPPAKAAPKIPVGSSEINQSDLKGLRGAWQRRQLVVFLGAGVSLPYGLPSWRNLVLDLLFEQTQHTKALGSLWPHYRRALAEWMTDYFDYNPLVLGRMIERDIKNHPERNEDRSFIEKLRERLYADIKNPAPAPTALQAIARLIEKTTPVRGVSAAVTFNYDDLLEQELAKLKVRYTPVIGPLRQQGRDFPVVHPHGYVPMTGPATRDTLVFTEDDYHKLTDTVFHWSLSELVIYLRKCNVLFIGLSMSDPNLRRLLDACRNSKIPQHWQIQKRHAVHDSEMNMVMASVERRARQHGEVLGIGAQKGTPAMEDAIRAALRQADTYDREVFESMGVKTIWIEDWADLPPLLDTIPEP
jgi:hypothetical protein